MATGPSPRAVRLPPASARQRPQSAPRADQAASELHSGDAAPRTPENASSRSPTDNVWTPHAAAERPYGPRSPHTAVHHTPAGTHDMATSLHPRVRPALSRRASQQSDSQRACRHAPHKTRRCPLTARRASLKTHHPPLGRQPATLQLQRRLLIQIIRRKRHHETLSHNELNQAGALADHSISRRHQPADTHGAAAPREAPRSARRKGRYCGPNSRSAWLSPAD